MPARASLCTIAFALALAGCEERPRPWQGTPDGKVVSEAEPFLPPREDGGSWLGDASLPSADGGEPAAPDPLQRPISRAGGLWTSCRNGFRPSGEPRRDVERLGLMCGPQNGMTRLGDTMTGHTADPVAHTFAAKAGACYRVIGVADDGVRDLDIGVLSGVRGVPAAATGSGMRLYSDHGDEPLAIVERERPFCSLEDDTFTVAVSAGEGQGRYAVQVYGLPPRR
jgi:hypothetical protein